MAASEKRRSQTERNGSKERDPARLTDLQIELGNNLRSNSYLSLIDSSFFFASVQRDGYESKSADGW